MNTERLKKFQILVYSSEGRVVNQCITTARHEVEALEEYKQIRGIDEDTEYAFTVKQL